MMVRAGSSAARRILAVTVLGSGLVFLDGTVVNIALPTIDEDLNAGLSGLQWTVDAYLVTLTALLLLGGSLGDRYGRRRLLQIGLVAFTLASIVCGLAPDIHLLIAARAAQGIGGALLVPGSLAIITASFHTDDRAWAVGAWSGMAGVSTAIAPFLGGWLIDAVSWRAIFFINVPLAAVALVLSRRVPESKDENAPPQLDIAGAVTGSVALGAISFALIESNSGIGPTEIGAAIIGVACTVAFVVIERRSDHPMMPPGIFRSRQFVGANLATVTVYGGLGGATFLVVLQLQLVLGYSALQAGASLLPISVLLLLFSARAGRLSVRTGTRILMTVGPIVAGAGLAWLALIGPDTAFVPMILGGATLFAIGMVLTVSPLTATVMAALDDHLAGVASGVNNAASRGAGLIAVAFLPAIVGLHTDLAPDDFTVAYRHAVWICAALCVVGGAISWAMIRDPDTASDRSATATRVRPAELPE
jgi:EmrB/QacA subfamily drug resistance transporter